MTISFTTKTRPQPKHRSSSDRKFIDNLISSYLSCYKASKTQIRTIIKIKKLELEVKKLNLARATN